MMIIISCVDSNNGMMFNNRRQSQDKFLRMHIIDMISPHLLWMNTYTGKQFADIDKMRLAIDDLFLDKAQKGDYCFVENIDISPYLDKIEEIVLFKWNRSYPADAFFPLDLSKWTIDGIEDFPGYSHEKITKEIYRR